MFFFLKKKRKMSLVLGGGGAKGFFHFGVINAIRDLDIEITEISGTSAGAIAGTIFAYDPDFNFQKILNDVNIFGMLDLAFTRVDKKAAIKIERRLKEYIKVSDFKDLKIPMSFNAADINTGEEIIFRKGNIFPGLIASMAVPFVFPLIESDGRYLCDGGVVNNLPISLLKKNYDKIIISNLTNSLPTIKDPGDGFSILMNALSIMQKSDAIDSILIAKKIKKDKMFHIKLEKYFSSFDFKKNTIKELMDLGYKTAIKKIKL